MPCGICASFSEEQLIKITHRKCYVKKKKPNTKDSSKDVELDLFGIRTSSPSLALMQTLKVLLTIFSLLLLGLSPYHSSHYHLKLQQNLSHQPQVLPYNRKSSPSSKNPWVLTSTSSYNNKWVSSRLLC